MTKRNFTKEFKILSNNLTANTCFHEDDDFVKVQTNSGIVMECVHCGARVDKPFLDSEETANHIGSPDYYTKY